MIADLAAVRLRTTLDAAPPRRIAVFRALQLGDLLCTVPAFRALRRRFPAAEITLIGLPWAAEFAARQRYLDHFEAFPGYPDILESPLAPRLDDPFYARMRRNPFDLAIQMHGDGSVTNGFIAALGARASLGYGPAGDDRVTVCMRHHSGDHEVIRWLRLVDAVDALADMLRPEYPTTPAEEGRAAQLLQAAPAGEGPLVGLHPGARDPERRWPARRFAELADSLVARHGARIVLTGSAGEHPITSAVRQAMHARALDLSGQTDLGTFAALLARLDLLVTNDTGASHLAAATGTRSAVLFGPTRPQQWAPLDWERHHVVDAVALLDLAADPAAALRRLPVEPVLATCEWGLGIAGDRPALPSPQPPAPSPYTEAIWTA